MESRDDLSECFFQWGLRLLRDGSHPAFGIATAQALMDPEPSMFACMGTGLGIWSFILSLSVVAFTVSWLLSDGRPIE